MSPFSRRHFLGAAGLAGLGSSLRGLQAPAGEPSKGPGNASTAENSLGDRWPQFSDRYFYGPAADYREMKSAYEKTRPGDVEEIVAVWMGLAQQKEERAEQAAASGRHITARDDFLRASNYYSQVWGLFLRLGDRRRILEPHRRMVAAFQRAWQRVRAPFQAIQIPFEDTVLPGVYFPARNGKPGRRPVVIELSGIDHIKERAFFRSQWIPYVERGLSYVTLDGPGQGECLVRGISLRPDSEAAARSVVDYLVKRQDVDPRRIGVFGTSFGSYFALRAAAGDGRVKAVACRSSVYDAVEDAYDFCPWIRDHLRLLVNAGAPEEALRKLAEFTLKGVVRKIQCPVFITHGSRDDIISVSAARKLDAEIRSRQKRIMIVEGAGHHPGNESEIEQFDWLASVL